MQSNLIHYGNMSIPNLKSKLKSPSIIDPKDMLEYLGDTGRMKKFKTPKSAILLYDRRLLNHIVKTHKPKKIKFFRDLYILNDTAVYGTFGMGAPNAVFALELLNALGIKKFISIGLAGTLQDNINIADTVICQKAIRDEGTSYHYIKPSKYAYPCKLLTNKIIGHCKKQKINFHYGSGWTTDAVYRETCSELKTYKKQNVLTVDMEASALFAAAKYRKAHIACIFTISDRLKEKHWTPKFYYSKTMAGLVKIFNLAIDTLNK